MTQPTPLLNNVLAFLALALPMVLEVIQDTRDFKKEKKDKKTLDVILRFLILIPCTLTAAVLTGQTMWQGFILAIGIYLMFFDFIMGWIVKRNIFYLGNTSKLDKLMQYFGPPWGQIIIRGILFASAMTAFYDLQKIIGEHNF